MKKTSMFMAMFFVLAVSMPAAWAADVDVYVEGAYTENDLAVYIYADINGSSILSSGVKLTYETSDLTLTSAEKNESVWFLGSETYMDPDTSTPGEVVIICGKLDEAVPLGGVSGDRVLLGKVRFDRTESSMPFSPQLSIGYANGTGDPSDDFKNFVETGGGVLDGTGVAFGPVTIRERGDANKDNVITSLDMFKVKDIVSTSGDYTCFADCNDDDVITSLDMFCIKNKL